MAAYSIDTAVSKFSVTSQKVAFCFNCLKVNFHFAQCYLFCFLEHLDNITFAD